MITVITIAVLGVALIINRNRQLRKIYNFRRELKSIKPYNSYKYSKPPKQPKQPKLPKQFKQSKPLKKAKISKGINQTSRKPNQNNNGTLIGYAGKRPIYISDDAKHIFICGTTGAGKTVGLSNFIKRAIEQNFGALIVDGKGDTGRGSLLDIVKIFIDEHNKKIDELNAMNNSYDNNMSISENNILIPQNNKLIPKKKLYVINLSNPAQSDKYNPFKGSSPTVAKDMIINMSDWSEEHYKVNTERYIQRILQLLELGNYKLSFKMIIKCIPINNFLKLNQIIFDKGLITKEQNESNIELTGTSGKTAQSSVARFSTIAESEVGEIFTSEEANEGVDISQALQEKAIILFVLNPLTYPELSPAFGRLVLIDAKKAIGNLFKFNTENRINAENNADIVNAVNKVNKEKSTLNNNPISSNKYTDTYKSIS